jgi:hypothetical protein
VNLARHSRNFKVLGESSAPSHEATRLLFGNCPLGGDARELWTAIDSHVRME